jgi:hypothetical protein
MHASLAFLNGAGGRGDPAGESENACLEMLNILCTTHQVVGVKVRAVASLGAEAARKAGTKCRRRLLSVSSAGQRVLPDI